MKKIFSYILIAFVLVAGAPTALQAAPLWQTGEKLVLDKPIADDAYVVGESVTIDRDIRGDLVVLGGDVTVNGVVTGDVLAVGGNLTLNGRVGDDLRLAGGDVTIAGSIADDLTGAGGTVTVADTAKIGGDIWAAMGDFTLYGNVSGDLNMWTGSARLNGQIAGNANVHASESLSFGKEGKVGKKLSYWALREDSTLSQYAKDVEYHKSVDTHSAKRELATLLTVAGAGVVIWKWLSLMLIGVVLIWVAPKYFPHLVDNLRTRSLSGKHFLNGLVLFFLAPLLIMAFAITVVGFPISVVMFFAYILLVIFGYMAGAYGLGSYILGHKHNTEWQQLANLGLGMLVLMGAAYVPVLGWLLQVMVLIYGLGAVWHYKMMLLKQYRTGA